jgi:hypothetical protein
MPEEHNIEGWARDCALGFQGDNGDSPPELGDPSADGRGGGNSGGGISSYRSALLSSLDDTLFMHSTAAASSRNRLRQSIAKGTMRP